MPTPMIHFLHGDPVSVATLVVAVEEQGLPYRCWDLTRGIVPLCAPPPQGVFCNRVCANPHSADEAHAQEFVATVLPWLEAHGRQVVNGSAARALAVNVARLYAALKAHDLPTPITMVASGAAAVREAAAHFVDGPVVLRANRRVHGPATRRFDGPGALVEFASSAEFAPMEQAMFLVQQAVDPGRDGTIRLQFIGRHLYYASHQYVDGACEVTDSMPRKLVAGLESFLDAVGVDVAAVDIVRDSHGRMVVADVDITPEYNPTLEAAARRNGARRLATHLAGLLTREYGFEVLAA